jgi:type IV secretion system protein VirD4
MYLLGKSINESSAHSLDSKRRHWADYYPPDILTSGGKYKITNYTNSDPLFYEGENHLITIAPTGSGKGVSVIIPNLLHYKGSVIVFDPKGENYWVTAEQRRKMGQEIICLDPFNVVGKDKHCLNPFDVFSFQNADLETDAQMLAELMTNGMETMLEDPFWELSAIGFNSGLIADFYERGKKYRNLETIINFLASLDLDDRLADLLDNKKINNLSKIEYSNFLTLPVERTRPSVLGTLNTYYKTFLSKKILASVSNTSFDLQKLINGDPITIYIIIPPDKLNSHKHLYRIWIGLLLKAILSRRKPPKDKTLFIIDECAQLGYFKLLETAITLCRGYGLQIWTFWQDLSQLKNLYKVAWPSILNNCSMIQFFNANSHIAINGIQQVTGITFNEWHSTKENEQIIIIDGNKRLRAQKLNYRFDQMFQGKAGINPYYS